MKFQTKKWSCGNNRPHNVIKVIFEDEDIFRAQKVANAKLEYIDVHSPSGNIRQTKVIKNRIIAGKLADASVARLIQNRINKQGSAVPYGIEEYDQSRTDDFKQPDPYDLLLTTPKGHTQTIEVRSSFSYLLARPELIIQKLSIYGWYTSTNKPKETPRDWYWQVIYYLRPRDIPQGNSHFKVDVFEDQIDDGEIVGYVVGGASRHVFEERGEDRKDQDKALYKAITPICSGLDCMELMNVMLPI